MLVQNNLTSSYKRRQRDFDVCINTPVIAGKHGRMKPTAKTDETGPNPVGKTKKGFLNGNIRLPIG